MKKIIFILFVLLNQKSFAGCFYYVEVEWQGTTIYSWNVAGYLKVFSMENRWLDKCYIGKINATLRSANINIYVPKEDFNFYKNKTTPPPYSIIETTQERTECESIDTLNILYYEPWMQAYRDSCNHISDSILHSQDPFSIHAFSSPNSSKINFSVFEKESHDATISIVDFTGQELTNKIVHVEQNVPFNDMLDLTDFKKGIILFRYQNGKRNFVKKIVLD